MLDYFWPFLDPLLVKVVYFFQGLGILRNPGMVRHTGQDCYCRSREVATMCE